MSRAGSYMVGSPWNWHWRQPSPQVRQTLSTRPNPWKSTAWPSAFRLTTRSMPPLSFYQPARWSATTPRYNLKPSLWAQLGFPSPTRSIQDLTTLCMFVLEAQKTLYLFLKIRTKLVGYSELLNRSRAFKKDYLLFLLCNASDFSHQLQVL